MCRRYLTVALVLASAPSSTAAWAQDVGPALDPGAMVTWSAGSQVHADNQRRSGEAAPRAPSLRDLGRSFTADPPARPVPAAVVTYTPSATVRARNQRQFVSRLAQRDPQAAADMQRAFTQKNIMAQIGKLMRSMALNPSNVADAIAVYLVTAWYGTRGSTDSTPAQFKAVSRQVAQSIAATPAFAGASDAVKQQIAEAMMIQAALIEQSVTAAQKQPAAMPRVKAAIAQGARSTFGFDIAAKRLGAQGLR